MFLNEMNVQWMFAEQSRENECSWMIKNVRKIPLTTSHIVYINVLLLFLRKYKLKNISSFIIRDLEYEIIFT
jgi:hypothetical protein